MSTSFKSLKANLLLSSAVAITGILVPIALSFSLQGLTGATPLQAFAAGAALCSTSLGTTFTVLASSGLSSSRLGVVLTSAAMMDDVIGLVMVQVISNLGGNFNAMTVVRPVLVSLAFTICVPLACSFVLTPITLSLNRYRKAHPTSLISRILDLHHTAFTLHTTLLIALVAGASYAGTSNLFAAYIAGATISWWDSEVPHLVTDTIAEQVNPGEEKANQPEASPDEAGPSDGDGIHAVPNSDAITRPASTQPASGCKVVLSHHEETTGKAVYERYYQQPVSRILQPFFFASIGFSIPITRMFKGSIVWRGIVYTVLMAIGKIVCGLWLVRFSLSPVKDGLRGVLKKLKLPSLHHFWGKPSTPEPTVSMSNERRPEQAGAVEPCSSNESPSPPNPFSLQPSLILALAMTARGEIGFLVSAVAESGGVFASSTNGDSESDIFLVVTWAIVLCTIFGPLGVGFCVRRVRAMQERKEQEQEQGGAGRDVLGAWGVGR